MSATTPAGLAEAVARNLGATVSYPPIPTGGAGRVADIALNHAGITACPAAAHPDAS